MKLSILLLVALAATATMAQLCSNNFQDEGELGVDCGGSCGACTCATDLTRAVAPPTLINSSPDTADLPLETGIDGTNLKIVIKTDPIVATTTTDTRVHDDPLTGNFFNGISYSAPLLRFIDNNPSLTNNFVADTDCSLSPASISTGTPVYPDDCTTPAALTTLTFTIDLNTALNTCQFKESTGQTRGTGEDQISDLPAPTGFTSYTTFEGVFKLITFQYGGLLAGNQEVAFELESSFTIIVAIQEQITVTSDAIQVIGAATNQSAITHQIWDTDNSWVDINALIGVSYPAAPSIFGPASTVSADGYTGGISLVELRKDYDSEGDELPTCAGRSVMIRPNGDCTGTVDQAAVEACVKDAYDDESGDQWCDANCDNACSIDDFFEHATGVSGSGSTSSVIDQLTQGSTTGDFALTSAGAVQSLPDTSGKCLATDGNGAGTDAEAGDSDACLSNIHIRLKPRAGWCDLNFNLRLRVGVVCRDDLNGDDTTAAASLIPDGLYNTEDATTTGFSTNGFTCTTSTLPSSTTFALGGGGGIDFSIASDNFCPQLVYEASLDGEMSIYESAEWGADCAGNGNDCGETPFVMANCVSDTTPEDGFCRSAPGIYADSLESGANTRKSQNTFVFGQTMYVETRVTAEAGVNIASTTIEQLWIGSQTLDAATVPTAAVTGPTSTVDNWAQLLRDLGDDGAVGGTGANADLAGTTQLTKYSDGTAGATIDSLVTVSDDIVTATGNPLTTLMTYTTNNAPLNSDANRLGNAYEGVSRATIIAQDETIRTTNLQTAATPTRIWAAIAVTYFGASDQEAQSARHVQSATLPAGSANRARLAASALPIGSGSTSSAQVGVRAGSTSGTGGSASTIAGFSSTTVLAAAVVLGAVVAVAAAGFFVARRRSQPTAKTTSSSLELNDAAMTQA